MDDNNSTSTTEKLTEKAFSRLMLTGVLGILVCIVCLCSATWAWFNTSTSAGDNKLGSGIFALDVSVADESTAEVAIFKQKDGSTLCTLSGAGRYNVTLTIAEKSTVTKGFCVLSAKGVRHSTAPIYNSGSKSLTFTLNADEPNLSIIFIPAWGTPASNDLIEENEIFAIGAAQP